MPKPIDSVSIHFCQLECQIEISFLLVQPEYIDLFHRHCLIISEMNENIHKICGKSKKQRMDVFDYDKILQIFLLPSMSILQIRISSLMFKYLSLTSLSKLFFSAGGECEILIGSVICWFRHLANGLVGQKRNS
jgi:hypothetical protein